MRTITGFKSSFFGAAALALCLPGLSFGRLNDPAEQAHAEAAWLDGVQKPKGGDAVLAGSVGRSGGVLSLSPAKPGPIPNKKAPPHSANDIMWDRENHGTEWMVSLFTGTGLRGNLGSALKSLASPVVLGYDSMVSCAMAGYSAIGLAGLAAGGLYGAVAGTATGVVVGIGGLLYPAYKAANWGFRKLFNIKDE